MVSSVKKIKISCTCLCIAVVGIEIEIVYIAPDSFSGTISSSDTLAKLKYNTSTSVLSHSRMIEF